MIENENIKILLVDDSLTILKTLSRILGKKGYQIEKSADGNSAIKKVTEWLPDMILLDLMMPEMSGEDVCKWIKGSYKYSYIHIIMLTGKSDAMDQVAGLDIGADDYISKPFNPDLLLARIRLAQRHIKEKREATFDPLTKLYNRRIFKLLISQEMSKFRRYGKIFSIIFIDLDHFKNVNDTFGHDAGDIVLKETANILRKKIREADFPARWGGEEIIILLPETDLQGAVAVAEKLRFDIADFEFPKVGHVTASFGVASIKDTEESLLSDADKALYEAKQTGRNRVVAH
ncbi:MAG: diguanylate cyclase [Desulfamplus sp.]|nr:diguanylate cyclase [Desulfamplus sp.]